jgi:hypothetical protein
MQSFMVIFLQLLTRDPSHTQSNTSIYYRLYRLESGLGSVLNRNSQHHSSSPRVFFLYFQAMKHGYSILGRVPVPGTYPYQILLWYSLGTHRWRTYFIFYFFATGTRVVLLWYARVHKSEKMQNFFLFLLFVFIYL